MNASFLRKTVLICLLAMFTFLVVGATAQAQCVATGDFDNDGHAMTVGDLIAFVRWLGGTGPAPAHPYVMDLNKDCSVDQLDLDLMTCMFNGDCPPPDFPLITCCEPDTVHGACCDGHGGCKVLSAANCQAAGGIYQGDGTNCTDLSLCWLCGDANGSGNVDVSDAVYLVGVIFTGFTETPGCDVNCDGSTDISDIVYLLQYIFTGGPAPCANCK